MKKGSNTVKKKKQKSKEEEAKIEEKRSYEILDKIGDYKP